MSTTCFLVDIRSDHPGAVRLPDNVTDNVMAHALRAKESQVCKTPAIIRVDNKNIDCWVHFRHGHFLTKTESGRHPIETSPYVVGAVVGNILISRRKCGDRTSGVIESLTDEEIGLLESRVVHFNTQNRGTFGRIDVDDVYFLTL